MKITFDAEDQGLHSEFNIFYTKEEWDNHPGSSKYMAYQWRCGTYQPAYYNEPFYFPCICLEGPTISNPNGADWICAVFIYNFDEEE